MTLGACQEVELHLTQDRLERERPAQLPERRAGQFKCTLEGVTDVVWVFIPRLIHRIATKL